MKSRIRNVHNSIIVLFILALPFSLEAQITFERTYGGPDIESASSVKQTNDNGYIFSGTSREGSFQDFDMYIVRIDNYGDTIWTRTYTGNVNTNGAFVLSVNSSKFLIGGRTDDSLGQRDVYILMVNSFGDSIWATSYGGQYDDEVYSAQPTWDSGYVITGYTESSGAGSTDVYLIKTDSLGDTLWTQTYGGVLDDVGRCIQCIQDSGYIIVGHTRSFGAGGWDIYLIRTNSAGDTLWTKTYGGNSADFGYCIANTIDGGFIISGETRSFGSNISEVLLIKTDSLGNSLWMKTFYNAAYFPTGEQGGMSVQQTADGGYIVAGYCGEFTYLYDSFVYLIKTDSSGDTMWTRTYGGMLYDWGNWIEKTSDGGYIIAGQSYSFGNYTQAYLIKTDSQGNVAVKERIPQEKRISPIFACYPNPFAHSIQISISELSGPPLK